MFIRPTTPVLFNSGSRAAELVGEARTEGGQPVQRFRKDLIRVGTWVHPADGRSIPITLETLHHWATTFGRMKAAGVKVPVPLGHTSDPEKNRGYLVDVEVENGTLFGKIDLIGDDAIRLAGRVEVSIFAPTSTTDGSGNVYQWPIEHVALVTDPVIPGQRGFEPIAASRNINPPVFRLAHGDTGMDFLKQLVAALGISTEGLDNAAIEKACLEKVGGMKTEHASIAASKTTLETDLAAARSQVQTLQASRGQPIQIDEDVLTDRRETISERFDALVPKIGKLSRDMLVKDLCIVAGANAAAASLCLSSKAAKAAGFADAVASIVINALKHAAPVPTDEQSGSQTVALNRTTPGGDGAPVTDEAAKAEGSDLAKRIGVA